MKHLDKIFNTPNEIINLYCKYIKEEKYELANSICIHYFVFLRIIYCWSSSYQRKVLISSIFQNKIKGTFVSYDELNPIKVKFNKQTNSYFLTTLKGNLLPCKDATYALVQTSHRTVFYCSLDEKKSGIRIVETNNRKIFLHNYEVSSNFKIVCPKQNIEEALSVFRYCQCYFIKHVLLKNVKFDSNVIKLSNIGSNVIKSLNNRKTISNGLQILAYKYFLIKRFQSSIMNIFNNNDKKDKDIIFNFFSNDIEKQHLLKRRIIKIWKSPIKNWSNLRYALEMYTPTFLRYDLDESIVKNYKKAININDNDEEAIHSIILYWLKNN